jgi:hypothetical protein
VSVNIIKLQIKFIDSKNMCYTWIKFQNIRRVNMAIREQGSGCHCLSDAPYWNPDMVTSERGPDRYHLSDALHRRPDVVSNE